MIRTRLTGVLLLALLMGLGGRARAQSPWQFPITATTMDETPPPSSTVNIGASPVASDAWDGDTLEPIIPNTAGALVFIRSLHYTSEVGYDRLPGHTALLQTDLRKPIGPGDPPKIWKLSVTYYGALKSIHLNLLWTIPNSVPSNLALKIGIPTDVQNGGGTDMRTTGTFSVVLTPGNANEIDVSAINTTPGAPFVTITPPTATVAVGAPLVLMANTTNSNGPAIWTSDAGPSAIVNQRDNVIAFTARQTGIYHVTATVQGANGGTASATAVVTAISTQLPPPTITSFTPSQGPAGTHVLIVGTGFNPNPSSNTVYFSGSSSPAAVDNSTASTTQLNVTVPFDAVTGTIRIITPNGTATSSSSFTVIPTQPPQTLILEVTPRVGAINSIIQVKNQSTVQWTNAPSVLFNGVPAVVPNPIELAMDGLANTPQTIYVKVPPGAQSGFVTAVSNDGNNINLQSTQEFTVLKPPTILTMQPAFWDTTDPINGSIEPIPTLTGFGFVDYPHPDGSAEPSFRYTIDYNGQPSNDPTKYTSIYGDEVTNPSSPLFGKGLTPSVRVQLQRSVLTGPIHFVEEMLNPISGQYDLIGDATTPVFTVIRKPVITSFSPGEGQAGDPVIITGKNFDPSNLLNNTVLFNGLSSDGSSAVLFSAMAPVKSVSSDGTQIIVNVPDNALTGFFSVTVTDKMATSPTPNIVVPSVTIVPGAGSIRAGSDLITLHAVLGGVPPGADRTIQWGQIDPAAGLLNPSSSDPTNTLLRTYTPPPTVPPGTDPVAGFPLVLHATTRYSATGQGGGPISGHGQAMFAILPPLGLFINPPVINILNPTVPTSITLNASAIGGALDLSQIQWSILGDLTSNSTGAGSLSTMTGPTTTYTPPPGADHDNLMGAVHATIPSLSISKDVPVTIHQPSLQFLSNNANPVTQTSATINWSMFPGQRAASYVEYGVQPSMYAGSVPNSLVGQGLLSATGQAVLTGLAPNTQYYYRITASAPGYASVTAAGQFFTLAQPQVHIAPNPIILKPGDSQIFTAALVNAPFGTPVNWSLSNLQDASLTQTSDPTRIIVQILPSAQPGENIQLTAQAAGQTDIASISIAGPIMVSVSPNHFSASAGQPKPQSFTVMVTGGTTGMVTGRVSSLSFASDLGTLVQVPGTNTWNYTPPADIPTDLMQPTDPALVVQLKFSSVDDPTIYDRAVGIILPPIRVSISPSAPQTVPAGGSIQFSSTVRNAANIGVQYLVNGTVGGDPSVGTIDGNGLYKAPANPPGVPVIVTARSVVDINRVSVGVPVTVLSGVSVAVTPNASPVGVGKQQQFTATVSGLVGTQDPGVIWSVNGLPGGSAKFGTIDANGVYQAPPQLPDPTNPVVTVSAVSKAVPNAPAGIASVTLIPGVAVLVTALSPTVPAGGTDTVTVQVLGTTNQNVTWSVNGMPGGNAQVGTITSQRAGVAVYTAPAIAPAQPVQIVAASQDDPTAKGSASITVQPPLAIITPANPKVPTGTTVNLVFLAAPTNTPIPNATWRVDEQDPQFGVVDNNGIYTAPAVVPDPPQAHVIATSKDDPRVTATDVITIVQSVPVITVTVTPPQAMPGPGQQVPFTASNSATPLTGVTWQIVNPTSGSGSIDRATGVYTAPGTISAPADVTVQATAQTGETGTAVVHLVPPAAAVTVKVSGPSTVMAGNAIPLFAIDSAPSNTDVNWSVNGIPNGSPAVGTITLSSPPATNAILYTAPMVTPSAPVTITAMSSASPSASDTKTVTVTPRKSLISPAKSTLSIGISEPFSFVDAQTQQPIPNAIWKVLEGSTAGTIDSNGTYTAPAAVPAGGMATIQATSGADPAVTAMATVTIVPRPLVTVQPAESTHSPGEQVQFKASDGQGNPLSGVRWLIASPLAGGGTIDRASGLYIAPSVVVAPFDVTIQAVASNGGTGQAVVHLSASAQSVGLLTAPSVSYLANDARQVDILWTTDTPSSSIVELGTASGTYPKQFTSTDSGTAHTVRLTGLTPGATYHYRVRSQAAGKADLVSGDQTFTARGEFRLDISPRYASATVTVDQTLYDGTQLPKTFVWPVGEKHTITPAQVYDAGVGTQEVFAGWDDPSQPKGTATVSIPASGTGSLKALYTTLYHLSISTTPPDLQNNRLGPKGDAFYTAGESTTITAPSPVTFGGQEFGFQNWLLDGKAKSGSTLPIVLDQPHTLVAIYGLLDQQGPVISNVVGSPNPTAGATSLRLQATASDAGTGGSPIQAAEYFIDNPGLPGQGTPMSATDGTFDMVAEDVSARLDISGWAVGDTHLLYVRGEDAAGNWGGLQKTQIVVSAATILLPSAVNDLKARPRSTTAIDLSWTAPGGAGAIGQADHYQIRFATSPIVGDAGFAAATLVANPPSPQTAGSPEAFTVPGLSPRTHYWFALKAFDAAGHASLLSNIADASTFGAPPQVLATTPKDGDTGVDRAAPIVVTFDQPMIPESVQIVLSPTVSHLQPTWSPDAKTVTLAHDPLLGDGTSYTATIAQGVDQNGDALAGPVSFSFITFKAPGGLAETPWPMYRHDPTHSGRNGYAGPAGTPTGPTWTAPVPSRFSSPAVGLDRTIYVGSQGDGLVAVNPDGSVKWRALQSADWVKSSPAIAKDGTIYIGLQTGELHAVAPDGTNQWTQQLEGAIVSSPAVGDDGTIYVGANNTLYAISPGDQVKWRFHTFGAIFSSPAVAPDGTVYVGSEDGGLYAIVADGTQPDGSRSLWVAQTTGGVRSSPVMTSDTVYVGSLDHGFYAYDRATGSQKWSFVADSDVDSSAALGEDGTLFVASVNGTLYALDGTGQKVWSVETGQAVEGSPTLDKNGVVYLGTSSPDQASGRLYAFDPKTGAEHWRLAVSSPISSSPIIGADGTLYVGSGNDLLLVGAQQAPATVAYGDLNGDGQVTIADAIIALEIAIHLKTPTSQQIQIADIAPKPGVNGQPFGDGQITIPDVIRILRRAVHLDANPWP